MSNNWFNAILRRVSRFEGMFVGAVTTIAFIATFFAGVIFTCIGYEDEPEVAHNAFRSGFKIGSGKSYSEYKKEKDCAEKHIGF